MSGCDWTWDFVSQPATRGHRSSLQTCDTLVMPEPRDTASSSAPFVLLISLNAQSTESTRLSPGRVLRGCSRRPGRSQVGMTGRGTTAGQALPQSVPEAPRIRRDRRIRPGDPDAGSGGSVTGVGRDPEAGGLERGAGAEWESRAAGPRPCRGRSGQSSTAGGPGAAHHAGPLWAGAGRHLSGRLDRDSERDGGGLRAVGTVLVASLAGRAAAQQQHASRRGLPSVGRRGGEVGPPVRGGSPGLSQTWGSVHCQDVLRCAWMRLVLPANRASVNACL